MIKRFLILLLSLFCLFSFSFAIACGGDTGDNGDNNGGGDSPAPVLPTEQTIVKDGITFELIEGTANYQVKSYVGTDTVLTVPDTIDGFAVTKICTTAFDNNTTLGELIFEDNILEFETNAIYNVTRLTKLTIPKNVEIFPSSAIKSSVKSKLASLTMPAHVISQAFTTDSVNPYLFTVRITKGEIPDGTFSDQVNGVVGLTVARQVRTLILDDEVTKVGVDCFRAMKMLSTLKISKNIKELPTRAFTHAYNLIDLELPEGLEVIGPNAFSSCFKLREVTLPASLTKLQDSAFGSCYKLNRVTIKENSKLNAVSESAFYNCHQLFEIVNLSHLNITLDSEKYYGIVKNAKDIFTDPTQTRYSLENGFILYKNPEIDLYCVMGMNDGKLTINNLPQDIDGHEYKLYSYAFYNEGVTGVTIPSGCTWIGRYAIAEQGNTSGLKRVTFENTSGWRISKSEEDSGSHIDVLIELTNATNFSSTKKDHYWKKI